MNDYYHPKKYLIIASIRSGGTLLSHALDSHPMIHAYRGECLHHDDPIRMAVHEPLDGLNAILSLYGYHSNIAKISWGQLISFFPAIMRMQWDGIIGLKRNNPIRVFVSDQIRRQDKEMLNIAHTFKERPKVLIKINPPALANFVSDYQETDKKITGIINDLASNRLFLSYEQIEHGFSDLVTHNLCRFLDVPTKQFDYHIIKRNPYQLSELIQNYNDLYHYFENNHPELLSYLG